MSSEPRIRSKPKSCKQFADPLQASYTDACAWLSVNHDNSTISGPYDTVHFSFRREVLNIHSADTINNVFLGGRG
ncbi:hypothetical protein J2T57_000546 [Natronocella acetinitrilica]|uniref:Uncharacterized protein n=1 Tax=Natronocella acetinitrilica TaxID=414046 RepID=A0AAE3G1T2_9GAMM|nr:hypothetical protein [Natronocella acetinitrilica]